MIYGALLNGRKTTLVHIEATPGPQRLEVIGLTEPATLETQVRLRANGFTTGRVVVHAGEPPRFSAGLDLPLAMALAGVKDGVFHGSLSLSGDVRGERGAFGAALAARRASLPFVCAVAEAAQAVGEDVPARGARTHEEARLGGVQVEPRPRAGTSLGDVEHYEGLDFSDVRHPLAQKALLVAAATGRSILFIGRPGCGGVLAARRLPSIMPELTRAERLDVMEGMSAAGLASNGRRPFRAPHYTCSSAGLAGSNGRLGEVDIARHGVLLLDDMPEMMRQPWEACRDTIKGQPGSVRLVAIASPCACGQKVCRCPENGRASWRARLAERAQAFDMVVPLDDRAPARPLSSAEARRQVGLVRQALDAGEPMAGAFGLARVLAFLDGRTSGTVEDVAAAVELHIGVA
jgi:magnesium chelatase family protein